MGPSTEGNAEARSRKQFLFQSKQKKSIMSRKYKEMM